MSVDQDFSDMPKNLNMPLYDSLRKAISLAIQSGYAKNVPDFAMKAMVSKLEELGIFDVEIKRSLQE